MDRGYGFIKTEQEGDIFFHRNDLEEVQFESLSEDQEVEFETGQGRDGRTKAVKVRLSGSQAPDIVKDEQIGDDQGGDDQGGGEEEA
jgi:cold shock CspA family protein